MTGKIRFGIFVAASFTVLCFQNCSDFQLQDEYIYEQSLSSLGTTLDEKLLPALLTSDDLAFWNANNAGDSIKKNPILGKGASFGIVMGRTSVGQFSMNSGNMSEEGRLVVSGGKIQAFRYSTASQYSYLEVAIPSSGDKMVIGVRFGTDANDLMLMVNGAIQGGAVVKVGTSLEFSYVAKTVNYSMTSGTLNEFMAYSAGLSNAQVNVLSRYLAGTQSVANVVVDPSLFQYLNDGSTTKDQTAFLAAKAIIDAKCLSCHGTSSSYGVFAGLTESTAISRGLVVAGNPQGSPIYYRLIGSAGGGTKNMPQGGSISAAEVQTISDWIAGIK